MLDFLDWRGMGCEWKPLLIFPQLRRPGAEEEEEAEEENNNYNNVEKKVLEMPARRSNYVPLSQLAEPPENPLQEPQQHYPGRHNNLSLPERLAYDHQKWYQFPYPEWSPGGGGVGGGRGFCPSNGLQRQSSGSSFADSSLSSDYPLPTLSPTVSLNASDSAFFNALYDDGWKQNNNEGRLNNNNKLGDGAGKNWAQQTEESYHLQLALALRLSAEATLTEDPHLLAPHCNEPRPGSSGSARNRAQAMSHRFWVNGCLSYYDKVPDGFYQIWGMNPYVWTMCNDVGESGRMPSMESLKGVDASDTSLEVILIDKCADSHLRELENKALGLAHGYSSTKELIEQLGKLVCMLMGGAASTEHGDLMMRWKVSSKMLRDCLNCIVLPIGSLSVGLCRHRALLFKVLADTIDLPCRIARGCKYCGLDDGSSCIVQYGVDREYFVDLIGWPGVLCELDSFLNGPSSSSIASPLRLPEFKSSKFIDEFRSLAKQYVADYESLDLQSKNIGRVQTEDSTIGSQLAIVPSDVTPSMECRGTQPPIKNAPVSNFPVQMAVRCPPERLANDTGPTKNPNLPGALAGMPGKFQAHDQAWKDIENKSCRMTPVSSIAKANLELSLAMDGLEIPWSDLVLKERIGAGSFGTVYHADWHGSDVAVKILVEQDFHEERLKEFLREVAIMKRLRHPNVVLFMGAVTSRPNLSIVTEYLPRGSLYRLLHRTGTREFLDERRRLRMALDVAKGMNYLHRLSPPIVHRDLKSPNLLVDKTWTVKVCDFGLSRLKANTFLSSKSAAGTPEWMAPEVLRDEPSNEKSDVYSFGVILWELITMQQPWSGLNPAQVVGAVGFQNRRLQIPKDMNPDVAAIIESCWANESWQRPTFASIMESLKPLIKPPASPPIHGGMPSHA